MRIVLFFLLLTTSVFAQHIIPTVKGSIGNRSYPLFISHTGSQYVVTNTNNSGTGSLKQAILDANDHPGCDTIIFTILPGGHQVIQPDSVLPEISDSLIIDASTQPGFAGTPIIEIDATNAGVRAFSNGVISIASSGVTIRGLIVNNAASTDAISINSYGTLLIQHNAIEGCYLGTDVTGTIARTNAGNGISIQGASYTRIGGTTVLQRNVISGNTTLGIRLSGTGTIGTLIEGNYIGVNASGDSALPNLLGGIEGQGDTNTVIGGTTSGARNIISGNGNYGIALQFGDSTIIQGNYIGTNSQGTRAIGNGTTGITIAAVHNSTIGGNDSTAANIICGNGIAGLEILGSRNAMVTGNYIGTNPAGDSLLGNGVTGIFNNSWFDTTNLTIKNNVICSNVGYGIEVGNASSPGNVIYGNFIGTDRSRVKLLGNRTGGIVTNNSSFYIIGGTGSDEPNTVAYNGNHGVLVSNTGLDTANTISGNMIYDNDNLGIKLGGLEYEAGINDSLDSDPGPNNNQNYPVIHSVVGDSFNVHVTGRLNSIANMPYRIEFFTNDTPDTLGYGEGKYYVGYMMVHTNNAGNADFTADLSISKYSGQYVTTTATDSFGNTSEFSRSVVRIFSSPALSVKDVAVTEGSADTVLANFSVSLIPVSDDTVKVQYSTIDGSASTAQGDYELSQGMLVFSPGESEKIISVRVLDDSLNEPEEQFNLHLFNVSQAGIDDSNGVCTITDDDSLFTYQSGVNGGWNLLSVPLTVQDQRKVSLFPTAVSTAFAFQTGAGYVTEDSMKPGKGYWLKFNQAEGVFLSGSVLSSVTINVQQGWNMIGSISTSVATGDIVSNPGGIVTSQFYEYTNGYNSSSTILPGKAYWVKVSQTGTLTLSATAMNAKNGIEIIPTKSLQSHEVK